MCLNKLLSTTSALNCHSPHPHRKICLRQGQIASSLNWKNSDLSSRDSIATKETAMIVISRRRPLFHHENLCGFFRTAPPKLKNIYYKDTEKKDQMIVSHMACFCGTGVRIQQCNINIFCWTNKITIKTYDTNWTSITHVNKQNWYG